MMISNLIFGTYVGVMLLATSAAVWWIHKQSSQRSTEFKIDTMVVVEIKPGLTMIGQVVEVKKEVALIKFYDNMHYHANFSQLSLLAGKWKGQQ